jgi:hypothetical protein
MANPNMETAVKHQKQQQKQAAVDQAVSSRII